MTRKLVRVEQEDINDGVRADGHYCAVSLAIRRETGLPLGTVDVKAASVRFLVGRIVTRTVETRLPDRAMAFIARFDDRKTDRAELKPFRFYLDIPE